MPENVLEIRRPGRSQFEKFHYHRNNINAFDTTDGADAAGKHHNAITRIVEMEVKRHRLF